MQEQAGVTSNTSSLAASSIPSSSKRSSTSALLFELRQGIESDDGIGRVPEIGGGAGGEAAGASISGWDGGGGGGGSSVAGPATGGSRRRGSSTADKENKRLKRLLRNRVSAQQARERKKVYMSELEGKVKELETKNGELHEKLSTLQNENQMLRQILKNTTTGSQEGRK